jgi:membrane protein implicated in regulation of membrane protease activity
VRQSNAGLTVLMLTGLALLVFSATGQPLGRWQAYELLALALCILATWFVLRQRRRQAIVHEGGIALIGRRGVRGVVAWPDVARVKVGDDVVELLSTEGVTLAQVNAEFFGSRRKLAEFAGAIAAQERDDAPWLP